MAYVKLDILPMIEKVVDALEALKTDECMYVISIFCVPWIKFIVIALFS